MATIRLCIAVASLIVLGGAEHPAYAGGGTSFFQGAIDQYNSQHAKTDAAEDYARQQILCNIRAGFPGAATYKDITSGRYPADQVQIWSTCMTAGAQAAEQLREQQDLQRLRTEAEEARRAAETDRSFAEAEIARLRAEAEAARADADRARQDAERARNEARP